MAVTGQYFQTMIHLSDIQYKVSAHSNLDLVLFQPAHPEPECSYFSTLSITAMEPLAQGQEAPLPLIQPSRPASAPPVMYENDKTKEGRSYKQYRPASTADNLTRCTNQNPVRYSPGKIFKSTPGLWLSYTDLDMPIFDKHPVVEDTYPRLMSKIREQYGLCGKLCEERAELWKFVHHREQEMLSEDVAFGCTWGHHSKKRVQWMEKIAAKQKELEASYETITTLMERVAKGQAAFRDSEKARLDAVFGRH